MIKKILNKIVNKMDNSETLSSIRRGLIMIIPVLMIGAFARVLSTLPIPMYQEYLNNAFSGVFLDILNYLYDGTMGIISLYITFSITVYYMRSKNAKNNYVFAAGIASVATFMVMSGIKISGDNMDVTAFGVKGMFTAIVCSVIVSRLFLVIVNNVELPFRLYADGVDLEFNDAIIALIPTAFIVILFTFVNYLICLVFDVDSFQNFYVHWVNAIFENHGRTFVNGFKFVVVSGLFWFIGIYGSDVLDDVSKNVFEPGFAKNMSSIAIGSAPKEILTKEFFNVFVLMGGCGTAICLLIAIVLFSKRKINRNLARISSIPMLFNVNEILTFGYPIIFNPYLLAPFIVTPSIAYCLAYGATKVGWVPVITHHVDNTVPIFISGYKATGSIKGSILQFVILIIGIFVYLPFVKIYDKSKSRNEAYRMKELTDILKKAEEEKEDVELMRLGGVPGALAKSLAADIKDAINHEEVNLYYQLQYDNDYNCIGAETLMRYKHPIHGYIYPPLVIKIAEESGILSKLERYLFTKSAKDYKTIKPQINRSYKMSVNVTISTILEHDFIDFLKKLKEDYDITDGEMCIEITEQMAIKSDKAFEEALNKVKALGYMIAIDDFSMGSTSIKYLQKNQFDIVKLDGSIVKEMMNNTRSKDIISSIVYLAHSLNFSVLAEYVETEDQIEALKNVGCNYYQGYHFSKAVEVDKFLEELQKEMNVHKDDN